MAREWRLLINEAPQSHTLSLGVPVEVKGLLKSGKLKVFSMLLLLLFVFISTTIMNIIN